MAFMRARIEEMTVALEKMYHDDKITTEVAQMIVNGLAAGYQLAGGDPNWISFLSGEDQ